jgi:hypothetical protein
MLRYSASCPLVEGQRAQGLVVHLREEHRRESLEGGRQPGRGTPHVRPVRPEPADARGRVPLEDAVRRRLDHGIGGRQHAPEDGRVVDGVDHADLGEPSHRQVREGGERRLHLERLGEHAPGVGQEAQPLRAPPLALDEDPLGAVAPLLVRREDAAPAEPGRKAGLPRDDRLARLSESVRVLWTAVEHSGREDP